MDGLYKNKYRIDSARLSSWDYGYNGMYFITICTDHMLPYFGPIEKPGVMYSKVGDYANQFGPQSQNIASIVRGFKCAVKTYANQHSIDFHWQTRYYDRIIKNGHQLYRVRNYIVNNPRKWLAEHGHG